MLSLRTSASLASFVVWMATAFGCAQTAAEGVIICSGVGRERSSAVGVCTGISLDLQLKSVGRAFPSTQQFLVVLVDGWKSKEGQLRRVHKVGTRWCDSGKPVPITLGHAGLAWGRGLHRKQTTNLKTEGDGKSPAGIFGIGTAFGRARVPPLGSLWNWLQVGENHFWVDDPASPQYNRLVELPVGQEPAKRWKSFERLKASYRYGVVVKHNLPHVVPGAGSAIFLHPWAAPTATTVGCTAMDERELIRIIRWLNPAQEPLLVQLPRAEFKRLAGLLP